MALALEATHQRSVQSSRTHTLIETRGHAAQEMKQIGPLHPEAENLSQESRRGRETNAHHRVGIDRIYARKQAFCTRPIDGHVKHLLSSPPGEIYV